ncbi:MAG: hypothetical protein JNL98_06560 [Bryobacterales bacterium]|nr:hypothetical protein [Bryobacterales bacterium]
MSKMIQIRNVPESVHRTLKQRAAQEGMTLSAYLNREFERLASQPTLAEWIATVRTIKPLRTKRTAAQIIRSLRDKR